MATGSATAPCYPAYCNLAFALGLEIVEIPVNADGALRPDARSAGRAHREKAARRRANRQPGKAKRNW